MEIKLKNNKEWIAEQQEKKNKRLFAIFFLFAMIASMFIAYWLYSEKRIDSGRIYPDFLLADTMDVPEPVVRSTNGYNRVIKCPNTPYTLIVLGDVLQDGEQYCAFQTGNYFVSVSELESDCETEQFIRDVLSPDIFGIPQSVSLCRREEGYLNARSVEAEAVTIQMEKTAWFSRKARIYSIHYKVKVGGEKDILISGFSQSTDLEQLKEIVENVFFSLHEFQGTEQEYDNSGIENISSIREGSQGDYDLEFVKEESSENPDSRSQSGLYEIPKDTVLLKNDEEKKIDVIHVYEDAVFQFVYQKGNFLKSISLIDPEGTVYYPDEIISNDPGFSYIFYVTKPQKGEWKFVFTASEPMGYFSAGVEPKSIFEQYLQFQEIIAAPNGDEKAE